MLMLIVILFLIGGALVDVYELPEFRNPFWLAVPVILALFLGLCDVLVVPETNAVRAQLETNVQMKINDAMNDAEDNVPYSVSEAHMKAIAEAQAKLKRFNDIMGK